MWILKRQSIRRTKRPEHTGGDRRRLVQLLVSLALFLLVFIGRGVFPKQIQTWNRLLTSDVDFKAAFQTFSQSISDGESLSKAFDNLCSTVFGAQPLDSPQPGQSEQPQQLPKVSLLSQTSQFGLRYAEENGILAGRVKAPVHVPDPPPEQSQAIVTAVAQAYTDDGVALPSNVSMAFYELGLAETIAPVHGSVTSTFGYRVSPITGKNEFHLALDIGAPKGTEIGAFADGVVEYIGESDEFGLYLRLQHANNVTSFYAHCSKLLVHKGDTVKCGQTVALVGDTGNATGPHLHLTITKDGVRLDPAYYVDPS